MKFLRAVRSAALSALSFLTTGPVSNTLADAVKNHALSFSGLATISAGAFQANPHLIAGLVVAGILTLIFNERVSA